MHDRIPSITDSTAQAMDRWFSEMADLNLIFHPEDSADSILSIEDGAPFFSPAAAADAQNIISGFFSRFGMEAVNKAAYPHFMRAAGMPTGDE